MKFPLWLIPQNKRALFRAPRITLSRGKRRDIIISLKPVPIFVSFVLAIFCIYLLLRSDIFLVKKIDFSGNHYLDNVVVDSALRPFYFESILFVHSNQIELALKQASYVVESVEIDRDFPSTLSMRIHEREGILILQSQDQKYLVDKDGMIFYTASDEPLPVLNYPGLDGNLIGQTLSTQDTFAVLQIINAMNNQEEKFTQYFLHEKGWLEGISASNFRVLFSLQKDAIEQAEALNLLVARLKTEGRPFSEVDLRFDQLVVR